MYGCDECCEKCNENFCTEVNKPCIEVTNNDCPKHTTQ